MKWLMEESEKFRNKIIQNEELIYQLSTSVDEILKKFGIDLKNMSYIFEPRIFSIEPQEFPEIMIKSRKAMERLDIEDFRKEMLLAMEKKSNQSISDWFGYIKYKHLEGLKRKCIPLCGGIDPRTLRELENFRISEVLKIDPNQYLSASEGLIMQIVGNNKLLKELSDSIFSIINEKGIKLDKNEGCVFTPLVFETPIYSQKIVISDDFEHYRGFGPQIYAGSKSLPSLMKIQPFPGIIESSKLPGLTPGVILDHWWWIGIPAPEMLKALDILREMKT